MQHATHHVANLATLLTAVLSLTLNGPAVLTYTSAALAIIWYVILIGEKIYQWTRKDKYDLDRLNDDE